MLRWLPLVWANLRRRKLRLVLTFASILIAFMLFGLLEALRTSMVEGMNLAGADRLALRNAAGPTSPMPLSYYEKIKSMDGVQAVASQNWFGAQFRTPQNPHQGFVLFATQPAALLEVNPELNLPAEDAKAWVQNRRALIVGYRLAQKFGWKKGQTIPIRSQFLQKTDGSGTWQFEIVGIFSAETPWLNDFSYMHYDYYNESLAFMKDTIGSATIRVRDARQGEAIARRIDAAFANSPFETETATEREMARQWREQFGDMTIVVTSVTLAVFFTMLLVTANRMAQSVRERTNEIGVMKTLGFGAALIVGLVLLESLVLTMTAGVAGMGLAYALSIGLAPILKGRFPGFELQSSSFFLSLMLMAGFALVAGLWPSLMAMRLKVVDALRRA